MPIRHDRLLTVLMKRLSTWQIKIIPTLISAKTIIVQFMVYEIISSHRIALRRTRSGNRDRGRRVASSRDKRIDAS